MRIIIFMLVFLYSCSPKSVILKHTAKMIDDGVSEKIFAEDNMFYVKNSLLPNLKLLEILYLNNDDPRVIKILSLGFCGYAYAFVDDKHIANNFFIKGIDYSQMYIRKHNISLKPSDRLMTDVFFANLFCKITYLDRNKDELSAIDLLSDIEDIVERIYANNPEYFNRFVAAIKAYLYASKPKIAGGNIEKARELFEYATTGSGSDFLLNKYLYLKFAVITVDEELFDRLSSDILLWQKEKYPYAFFNLVAKEKTKELKEMKNEYF